MRTGWLIPLVKATECRPLHPLQQILLLLAVGHIILPITVSLDLFPFFPLSYPVPFPHTHRIITHHTQHTHPTTYTEIRTETWDAGALVVKWAREAAREREA